MHHVTMLERMYENYNYLKPHQRLELSAELNISEQQVQAWFRDRRSRDRKNGTMTPLWKKRNIGLSSSTQSRRIDENASGSSSTSSKCETNSHVQYVAPYSRTNNSDALANEIIGKEDLFEWINSVNNWEFSTS